MSEPASKQPQPRKHPRNALNDLTGRDWIKFTKSWFICDSQRYQKNKGTELHPARYPEEMVSEFIGFFSKPGDWVLDPFCGSGATLVSCQETGRNGVGIELSPEYAQVARRRLMSLSCEIDCHVLSGDARDAAKLIEGAGLAPDRPSEPCFDFIITSPPYFNMLRKSRGGVESVSKKRAKAGLGVHYGDDERDLGNIDEYAEYIATIGEVFDQLKPLLRPERYLVIVAQNLRDTHGEVRPLAWDLGRRVADSYSFQGERVWCQNSKPLGIWGYPKLFIPNYHHHYCMIFQNTK